VLTKVKATADLARGSQGVEKISNDRKHVGRKRKNMVAGESGGTLNMASDVEPNGGQGERKKAGKVEKGARKKASTEDLLEGGGGK